VTRFPTASVLLIVAVLAAIGGWFLFAKAERERYAAVKEVRQSRSEIRLTYHIDHERGPIASEEWRFANLDGRSSVNYIAVDRHGTRATFQERVDGYDVTFLFDKLVQDGIWELQTRPFRGKPDVHVVRIEQVAQSSRGSHEFRFTDPHYLATSAGREYHLRLDRTKPVPDLLRLDSTSSADVRYQKIVDDFEGFGSAHFKRMLVAARHKLLTS
jgi:hypothetical protein